MNFELNFSMKSNTFDVDPHFEICRILKKAIEEIRDGKIYGSIIDINDEEIGSWEFICQDNQMDKKPEQKLRLK